MSSPTARTLQRLRKTGWQAQTVERWNPHAKIRQDLFGVIDVLACRSLLHGPAGGILGVQATTRHNLNARLAKAVASPLLYAWLSAGARFEVWGWEKRDGFWQLTVRPVRLSELEPPVRRPNKREELPLYGD